MTIKKSQKYVDHFIKNSFGDYWHPLSSLARLVEEVGELSREINHKYGQKIKRREEAHRNLEEEIGDIMFTLICIANHENMDLEQGLKQVIKKYLIRDKDRWNSKKEFLS